jgi:hypothetical protein
LLAPTRVEVLLAPTRIEVLLAPTRVDAGSAQRANCGR